MNAAGRRPLRPALIWTRTKTGQGFLRSVRNPFSGHVECLLYDFFEAHRNPADHWHSWIRKVRADGFPIRFVVIGDRIEALAPHASLKHLIDDLSTPSHLRRVAYMQLRRAEREARRSGL